MDSRSPPTALAGVAPARRAAQSPVNIDFILADELGGRHFQTPNIDRSASQDSRFNDACAACPVCSLTRASILTGKGLVRTSVTDWIPGRPSHEKGPILKPRIPAELRLSAATIVERLNQ